MPSQFILYARKSSDSEERQVLSIEAQVRELKEYAAREQIKVVDVLTESKTAKIPGRKVFGELISRIEKGETNGILAWHPDRLARNSVDGGHIVYLLDSQKVKELRFPTFWFENTPQGKFMLNIAFGQSKYYVDNLSENVRRGIRQKLSIGQYPGPAPIGYNNDLVTHTIVVDEACAPLVSRLFETFASGQYSIAQLRELSFSWGLVSRRSKRMLSSTETRRILTNPFYYGLIRYDGEVYKAAHKPIISKKTFDACQEIFLCKSRPQRHRKGWFPFLDLAKCLHCGCSITAERQKGRDYYRCSKKKGKCPEPFLRADRLEPQIVTALHNIGFNDDVYDKVLTAWTQEREGSRQHIEANQRELREKLSEVSLKLDRLLDLNLSGHVTNQEYAGKKELLLNQKLQLEAELAKTEGEATGWLEPAREFMEAARKAHLLAIGNDKTAQKHFLKNVGSNFSVSQRTLEFDLDFPWVCLARKGRNQKWRSQPRKHSSSVSGAGGELNYCNQQLRRHP